MPSQKCSAGSSERSTSASLRRAAISLYASLSFALGRFVYLATLPGKRGFGAPREPWSMNAAIAKLNEAYKEIAARRRLALVDLSELPAEHFCDGIHLTQTGNKWVAERFCAAIEARR